MSSPSKSQASKVPKPAESEIRRRWAALDLKKRYDLFRLTDPVLAGRLKHSILKMYGANCDVQEMLGQKPGDLNLGSALLKEVFDFRWREREDEDKPNVGILTIKEQTCLITLTKSALIGDKVLEICRGIDSEFLSAKNKRSPQHPAQWKNLVKNHYASLTALENALVQLIEQIFWSLGTNSAYEITEEVVNVSEPEPMGEDVLDWLADGVDTSKAAAKKSKKKEKKGKPEEVSSHTVFETPGDDCADDDDEVNEDIPGCTNMWKPLLKATPQKSEIDGLVFQRQRSGASTTCTITVP